MNPIMRKKMIFSKALRNLDDPECLLYVLQHSARTVRKIVRENGDEEIIILDQENLTAIRYIRKKSGGSDVKIHALWE